MAFRKVGNTKNKTLFLDLKLKNVIQVCYMKFTTFTNVNIAENNSYYKWVLNTWKKYINATKRHCEYVRNKAVSIYSTLKGRQVTIERTIKDSR